MGNPDLTKAPNYYTPDVPWVMYYNGDEALHGAYWHDNFGKSDESWLHQHATECGGVRVHLGADGHRGLSPLLTRVAIDPRDVCRDLAVVRPVRRRAGQPMVSMISLNVFDGRMTASTSWSSVL